MKKNTFLLGVISLFLIGCTNIELGEKELTLFVASDLHLYSNNLIGKNNITYTKDNFTSDGRVQEYDYELVDSLVKEVNDNIPSYLILTGDLSYNGEKDSLIELKNKLDDINKDTKVLVIPGNHDCYSMNSFNVLDDKMNSEENVTYDDFKDIFKDYGYLNAYSYDKDSLSYIYELSSDKWILMLDTSNSEYNYEYDMNIVGGTLDESTCYWLEDNLKYAYENGIEVISASHHNILVHNKLFEYSYTLSNSKSVIDLFKKYSVKLNFSGHLHIQSIKNYKDGDYNFYDISSGSLLDYGNRYGVLDIYENYYQYTSKKINFLDKSFDFDKYSFEVFYSKYYKKSLSSNEKKYKDNGKKVTDLLSKINCYYFDGDYETISKLKFENFFLIEEIKRNTTNYDKSYIKSIIDVDGKNQHDLLIRK